jgi:hypothetical protein
VRAGRKFLHGRNRPEPIFTRDEVELISTMEAHNIAVEAVAAEVGLAAARWEGSVGESGVQEIRRESHLPSLEAPAPGDTCPACGTQRGVVGYCGECEA